MFDVLLKTKFYTKCKSDIKLTRTRTEMIKKKRKAMQKYLRNDVADLLRNGLDLNAYGRAEGLLVEQIRTSCYESIEPYCLQISTHLSAMDKQSECPEDCRQAVSSLMFAAARFADLPELRDLRNVFSEKYGNFLDCYVNKEFVEKMTSGHPSKEMKLKLLQEIAAEYGLEWDSKALENKLYNDELACKEDSTKETHDHRMYPLRDNGFKNAPQKSLPLEKKTSYKYYEQKSTAEIEEKRPEKNVPPVKDIEVDTVKTTTEKRNKQVPVRTFHNENNEEDKQKTAPKYTLIPPPYTKPGDENVGPTESAHRPDSEKRIPKSVRSRNLKPRQNPEVVPQSDDKERRNKEKAAKAGQRVLKFFDRGVDSEQRDEEETKMDKLLQYYSRKNGPRESDKTGSKKAPNRALSLPSEIDSSPETSSKKHNRAASFEPEMLNPNVHPKLPDYDEFVARLAAYRRAK